MIQAPLDQPALLICISTFSAYEPLFRGLHCGYFLGASTKTSYWRAMAEVLFPTLTQYFSTPAPPLLLTPNPLGP